MELTSSENNNSWKRLEILSAGGMSHLNFQFNTTKNEDEHKNELEVLTLLMYNAFRGIYQQRGLKNYQDKDHYELSYTENFGGFHFAIRWEYAYNSDQALAIVKQVLDYVLSFDVNTNAYENIEIEVLVKGNIVGAKDFAEAIKKDIFDEQRFEFKKDYYSPFD